jgi:heptose-I-phosphate ethanolaminephosphotransferase
MFATGYSRAWLRAVPLPSIVFYGLLATFACYLEFRNFEALSDNAIAACVGLAFAGLGIEFLARASLNWAPHFVTLLLSSIFRLVFGLPFVMIYLYNLIFGSRITKDVLLAPLQTTMFEVTEFISVFVPFPLMLVCCGLVVGIVLTTFGQRSSFGHLSNIGLSAVIIGSLLLLWEPMSGSRLLDLMINAPQQYIAELRLFLQLRDARQKALPQLAAKTERRGETYVVVIGESLNRDHTSLYGYSRKTTPWLDKQEGQQGWIKFTQAYSNYVETIPALTFALTAANQYNGHDYIGMPSFVDVLKSAGFKTYWISNQVGLGGLDNPITAIAENSDVYIRTNYSIGMTLGNSYDLRLVDIFKRLKTHIDPNANNLLVFHLLGNHFNYCRRFPPAFAMFASQTSHYPPSMVERINCYDDSVRYTDMVISEIYTETMKLGSVSIFLFMPDHGEDVVIGDHDPASFTYDMARIPFVVWASEHFAQSNPARINELRSNSNRVFTNDLLYDLLVGLTGVKTIYYEEEYDPSSPKYSLSSESAMTLHGKKMVRDDPSFDSPSDVAMH